MFLVFILMTMIEKNSSPTTSRPEVAPPTTSPYGSRPYASGELLSYKVRLK